jgi:hypothetical protein
MRLLVCLGVALALGACGGSDDEQGPSSSASSTTSSSTSTRTGDEAEVARVAESYYTALAKHDWKAACETRAPTERDPLARSGRSCEQAFEDSFKGRPGADQFFAEVEIGDVRVTGDRARADVVHPRQQEPMTGLAAVRENGQWFLKHLLGLEPRDPFASRPRSPR